MRTLEILDKLGSIVGGVFAVAGFVLNLLAARRVATPGSSPVEARRFRSHRHILVTVGAALLAAGLALLAGAWWAGRRDNGRPADPGPTLSVTPSVTPSTGQSSTGPAPSVPAGPRPDRAGPRSITMRPYPIPQNNYDPRTDKVFPKDTAAITFECRRRTSDGGLAAGCDDKSTPVFTLAPNKDLKVQIAEVTPTAASRGFPAACDGLRYDDNPDFLVIAEKHAYCVQSDDWVAVIRVEDLPGEITSASTTIDVHVSYWRR